MLGGYEETREERDARLQMEQRWEDAERNQQWMGELFDLLILARNSNDDEALRAAIDMVAIAAGRSDEPSEADQGLIPIPDGYAEQ